jgi:hypothetical protein
MLVDSLKRMQKSRSWLVLTVVVLSVIALRIGLSLALPRVIMFDEPVYLHPGLPFQALI